MTVRSEGVDGFKGRVSTTEWIWDRDKLGALIAPFFSYGDDSFILNSVLYS